jgi:hypothetical protein
MDLSTLSTRESAERGVKMEVTHPITGEPVCQDNGEPVTITLAGADSDRYKRIQRFNLNRRLQKSGKRGSVTLTAEELDAERLEIAVACTLGWDGVIFQGQPAECNAVVARQLYSEVTWLREQVDDFITDRTNFLKASSTT